MWTKQSKQEKLFYSLDQSSMGDVPWKGQHGAKRLVKEFRHISEQIEKGMLPQISNLSMHQVGATAPVSNERPRRLPLVPDRI